MVGHCLLEQIDDKVHHGIVHRVLPVILCWRHSSQSLRRPEVEVVKQLIEAYDVRAEEPTSAIGKPKIEHDFKAEITALKTEFQVKASISNLVLGSKVQVAPRWTESLSRVGRNQRFSSHGQQHGARLPRSLALWNCTRTFVLSQLSTQLWRPSCKPTEC